MKFSFANKLFTGFSLLSLLTILLGVTTFSIIDNITRSQKNITLLQEFELRVNTLEAVTNAQSNAAFISARSYDDFLQNLDRAGQLAEKILHSGYCAAGKMPEEPDSCQAIMLEAMDFYPQAAIQYYEKTLLTLRLIAKNHFVYRNMLEAQRVSPGNEVNNRISSVIHQMETLKHEFEESNNVAVLDKMKTRAALLPELEPDPELLKLARTFVVNSEETYRNRLEIAARQEKLAEATQRFRGAARNLHDTLAAERLRQTREARSLIMFLGLCSIAMTLLFWLLTSRRLNRFLGNQKKAISSIKTGHYDYPVIKDSHDELHELYLFTKDLADNLKEEVAVRECSQQEKKDLQFQLMQAQRLESIGILAGGIAHDFNNVLTGITGYTDLALARLEDNHPVKRYLETIAESSRKAAEMTRQLLVFSRKQETAKKPINLNTLTANLLKMLDRMIGDDIILELIPAPELPQVMADPDHIEHVLLNMAVNAKDAMPEGGRLIITTSNVFLDKAAVDQLDGVDPGSFVQISISDSGAGMPEEIREKIFDPFFTTKSKVQGTGLGLATVLGIIKQHNGHITVESAAGRGTTFNIYLPAIANEPRGAEGEQSGSTPTICRGRETILLVDDNGTARDFICETLEYCGYKVLTAGSGSEAVKIMHQADYPIDLLLTDVIMPGMNGGELAAKAREVHPGIKVIFMSGYDDLPNDEIMEKVAAGNDFLKKPMSIKVLSRKVRECLDR